MALTCDHRDVIVDYDHPHGLIRNVRVRDLIESDPKTTRRAMELHSPRCATCGAALAKADIVSRADLFDDRFRWRW